MTEDEISEAMSIVERADRIHKVIDGIFCPNESTTFAMMRVLQDNGWAGTVRFVGFDAYKQAMDVLKPGDIVRFGADPACSYVLREH